MTPSHDDRQLRALYAAQASNRANTARKMLSAVKDANSIEEARSTVEALLQQMIRNDELHDYNYLAARR